MHDKAELSKMGKKFLSYLETLCQRAKELGASEAIAIPVADIVVDERARIKCLVPVCSFYGSNLMCPPNVMPISEFKEILKDYHGAILIKIASSLSGPPDELASQNDLSKAWEIVMSAGRKEEQLAAPALEYAHALRDNMERLYEIISQIESICLKEGYSFAAGFSAGGCLLCDRCVGIESGLPCRHPFKARPSMEAMGIDVVATAKRVGLHINFDQNKARGWVGLILVD